MVADAKATKKAAPAAAAKEGAAPKEGPKVPFKKGKKYNTALHKSVIRSKAYKTKQWLAKKRGEAKDLKEKKPDPNGTQALSRKVRSSRRSIAVVKRQGGTVQFVKNLRNLRKIKLRARLSAIRKVQKARKYEANKAAFEAVKGKTTKDGKPKLPPAKKMPTFDVKKMRNFYSTQLAPRKLPSRNFFPDMKEGKSRRTLPKLRRNLVPGTVCVVVAGRHKGRRVVFLKQLRRSGLCLVTGPYNVNGVPMRRMNQNYLIATSERIDMSRVKVPRSVTDSYFTRTKVPKKKKSPGEEDIFQTKKKERIRSTTKEKKMQEKVDKMVHKGIRMRPDSKMLFKYLGRRFGLMGTRYPHRLNF